MAGESTTPLAALKHHGFGPHRRASLVLIHPIGVALGSRYALGNSRQTIGRNEDCDIRIRDVTVSRVHARIELDADSYRVIDFQSTNGTFINNVRVNEGKLADGDYLRIGNCVYRFLLGNNPETKYHQETRRLILDKAVKRIQSKPSLTCTIAEDASETVKLSL